MKRAVAGATARSRPGSAAMAVNEIPGLHIFLLTAAADRVQARRQ